MQSDVCVFSEVPFSHERRIFQTRIGEWARKSGRTLLAHQFQRCGDLSNKSLPPPDFRLSQTQFHPPDLPKAAAVVLDDMQNYSEAEHALGVVLRGVQLFGADQTFLPCQVHLHSILEFSRDPTSFFCSAYLLIPCFGATQCIFCRKEAT